MHSSGNYFQYIQNVMASDKSITIFDFSKTEEKEN